MDVSTPKWFKSHHPPQDRGEARGFSPPWHEKDAVYVGTRQIPMVRPHQHETIARSAAQENQSVVMDTQPGESCVRVRMRSCSTCAEGGDGRRKALVALPSGSVTPRRRPRPFLDGATRHWASSSVENNLCDATVCALRSGRTGTLTQGLPCAAGAGVLQAARPQLSAQARPRCAFKVV